MRAEQPLYESLASEIEAQIRAGTLKIGERIPSVRKLSRLRKVSVSTVLEAYLLLEQRGRIEARPQSGFFVRGLHDEAPPEPRSAPANTAARAVKISDLVSEVFSAARSPGVVPLGAACPSPELFPNRQINLMIRSVLRDDPFHSGKYDFPPGDEALRRQLARRLSETGGTYRADDLIVTVGAMEAIQLSLRAIASAGDTIAVETPTYFGILECIEQLGMKALELPMHPATGLDLEATAAALKKQRVRAGVFMPNFHNPLGTLMPDASKRALVELFAQLEIPLVEDDVYRELPHSGHPPRTLKSYDKHGRVLLCGSFSKTLSPGLRVGWIAPGLYYDRVKSLQLSSTLAVPSLPQKVLARYLEKSSLDRHLRKLRHAYGSQIQRATQVICTHFPEGTRVSRPQGGFMLWIELPGKVDTLNLHRRALEKSISITPGVIFSASGRFRNCFRLNCGNLWSERIERAMATLGRLASE